VSAGGLFGLVIQAQAKAVIEAQVKSRIQGVLDDVAGRFDLKSRKGELITQLRTLDDLADARFEGARFSPDGVVLDGRIWLAPRRPPVNTFVMTPDEDGYTAFQSWIPGGRIDRFEWSWSWFNGAYQPGQEAHDDRFLLGRPGASLKTKFGRRLDLSRPLPGIDGMGRVCLRVKGVQVDPQSGQLIPVETYHCRHFGFEIPLEPLDNRRLFLREYALEAGRREPLREEALFEVGAARAAAPATNTLVVRVARRWDEDTAAALRQGLDLCERDDAGLLVMVLFREGLLREDGDALAAVGEFARNLSAPLLVSEDVDDAWAAALDIPSDSGEPAWRLLRPDGGISWSHDGRASPEQLARDLGSSLVNGSPAGAQLVRPGLDIGARLSPIAVDPSLLGMLEQPCPPPPVGRGIGPFVLAFLHPGSPASAIELDRLRREADGGFVAVVLDGEGEAQLADEFAILRDPRGALAARLGVRHWPTTLRLNELGIVRAVEVGAAQSERSPEDSL
jgi:hypothetical protein